jgi:hypothetical protein
MKDVLHFIEDDLTPGPGTTRRYGDPGVGGSAYCADALGRDVVEAAELAIEKHAKFHRWLAEHGRL